MTAECMTWSDNKRDMSCLQNNQKTWNQIASCCIEELRSAKACRVVSYHSTILATHDEGRLDGRDVGLKDRMRMKVIRRLRK
jgi:hypothetical protein